MNILYICTDYGIPILGHKGASVHVRELVNAFSCAGHSVIVASPLARKSLWAAPEKLNAEFLLLPASDNAVEVFHALKSYTSMLEDSSNLAGDIRRMVYGMEVEPRLVRKFRSLPPDFIYVRAALFSTVGVDLAKELKRPLVVELNAPLSDEHTIYRASGLGDLARKAEQKLLCNADVVLTVSKTLREYAVSMGASANNVHVVPNAVNSALFFPAPKNATLLNELRLSGGPVIGFVGGLRPWHGAASLINLTAKLALSFPNIKLVIVGDGPLKAELERQIDLNNLHNNVLFAGTCKHSQVPDLIRLFDIALAPYPKADHAFYFSPLKIFEYMGCGVPVVASRTGQIEEVIEHEYDGMLYEPGNDDELLAVCTKLLNDKEMATTVARNAAATIGNSYTWTKNAQRVIDIVNEMKA